MKRISAIFLSLVLLIVFSACTPEKTFYFSTDQFIDTYESVSNDDLPKNIIVKDTSIELHEGTIDQAVYFLETLEKMFTDEAFKEVSDDLLETKGIYSKELVSSKVYLGISAENPENIRINLLPDGKVEE